MKKSISLLLIMCMVLAGCGKSSTDSASDEITLAENQSLKYGQVTKINGNEITIALAKQVSASEMQSQRGNKTKGTQDSSATGDANTSAGGSDDSASSSSDSSSKPQGEMPSDMQQGGTKSSDGANQGGEMPSGDSTQGGTQGGDGTTGGGTPPDMNGAGGPGGAPGSESSSGSNSSKTESSDSSSTGRQNKTDKDTSASSDSKQNQVMYQLTGEEETLTIPVGTKVTTSLGATTTFSRIAADDTLKLLMQKNDAGEEVVVGVWIVA